MSSRAYVCPRVSEVLWHEVDEGWVGYEVYAGVTFLLDPLSRFVFDVLSQMPEKTLVSALPMHLERAAPELSGDSWEQLSSILALLESVSLIEVTQSETE